MKKSIQFPILTSVFLAFCLMVAAVPEYALAFGKVSDSSQIYWEGGEDFSYDYQLEDLIPIEYYDMDLGTSISKKLPNKELEPVKKKPKIAIIIDDMGVNRKMSERAVESLEPGVTLSFLPYARDVQLQVDIAKTYGHEIMLHLPWEPDRKSTNSGPDSLSTENSFSELDEKLSANLDKFTGYDGVNNHMGSKFSRYRDGIEVVMSELKERDMFFLDSKTTSNTLAEKIAREYSVPTTHRNIFLDHGQTKAFVKDALKEVERVARLEGSAVAIGHPKEITIEALEAWLPTLEKKGFELVKMKDIISERQAIYNSNVSHIQPLIENSKIKIIR